MGWNKAYAQSVPKEQWVKEHSHHSDEFDLGKEYDKMVPVKKEVKEPVAKPAKKAAGK